MNGAPSDVAALLALDDCTLATLGERLGGGNSAVRRVALAGGLHVVVKQQAACTERETRWEAEHDALTLLADGSVARVPRVLGAVRERGLLVLEDLGGTPLHAALADGRAPLERAEGALCSLLHGLRRLHARTRSYARWASDAQPSLSTAHAAITQRLRAFDEARRAHAALNALLSELAEPALDAAFGAIPSAVRDEPRTPSELTLSPSDVGAHNAVWLADGQIAFVDLEYFGLDDPAKLFADLALHPAALPTAPSKRRHLIERCLDAFEADAALRSRTAYSLALHRVKWALIALNEFRPDRLARRRHAGAVDDGTLLARQETQLALARRLLVEGCDDSARAG